MSGISIESHAELKNKSYEFDAKHSDCAYLIVRLMLSIAVWVPKYALCLTSVWNAKAAVHAREKKSVQNFIP